MPHLPMLCGAALHTVLAYPLIAVWLLHLAGALVHRVVRRNGVFETMASREPTQEAAVPAERSRSARSRRPDRRRDEVSITRGRRTQGCLIAALLICLVPTTMAAAAEIEGFTVCADDYALCSESLCKPIAGDTGHVACPCEGPFHGLNIGHSTCKAREQALMSTFALHNLVATPIQKPPRMLACAGDRAGPWAACLDAPCTTKDGAVSCKCPIHPASDYFFLSETCPDNAKNWKALCSRVMSAVSSSDASTSQKIISSFYGKPPKVLFCPAPKGN